MEGFQLSKGSYTNIRLWPDHAFGISEGFMSDFCNLYITSWLLSAFNKYVVVNCLYFVSLILIIYSFHFLLSAIFILFVVVIVSCLHSRVPYEEGINGCLILWIVSFLLLFYDILPLYHFHIFWNLITKNEISLKRITGIKAETPRSA